MQDVSACARCAWLRKVNCNGELTYECSLDNNCELKNVEVCPHTFFDTYVTHTDCSTVE